MAAEEKKADAAGAAGGETPTKSPTPKIFIVLSVLNMAVVLGIGSMVLMGKKRDAAQPKIDDIVKGEQEKLNQEKQETEFIGKLIPLETFLVNLSGSQGRKLLKVNMELEVTGDKIEEEIEKRKVQIRDIIIFILSSKSYSQVSNKDGQDGLRDEIRDTVNAFLTRGRIKRVYFTEFIYN